MFIVFVTSIVGLERFRVSTKKISYRFERNVPPYWVLRFPPVVTLHPWGVALTGHYRWVPTDLSPTYFERPMTDLGGGWKTWEIFENDGKTK